MFRILKWIIGLIFTISLLSNIILNTELFFLVFFIVSLLYIVASSLKYKKIEVEDKFLFLLLAFILILTLFFRKLFFGIAVYSLNILFKTVDFRIFLVSIFISVFLCTFLIDFKKLYRKVFPNNKIFDLLLSTLVSIFITITSFVLMFIAFEFFFYKGNISEMEKIYPEFLKGECGVLSFDTELEISQLLNNIYKLSGITPTVQKFNASKNYKRIKIIIVDDFKDKNFVIINQLPSEIILPIPTLKAHGDLIKEYIQTVLSTKKFRDLKNKISIETFPMNKDYLKEYLVRAKNDKDTLFILNCSFRQNYHQRISTESIEFLKQLIEVEKTENLIIFKASGNEDANNLSNYDLFTLAGIPLAHIYTIGGIFRYQKGEFAFPSRVFIPYKREFLVVDGTSFSTPSAILYFIDKLFLNKKS